MGSIFISYRRDDTTDAARLIFVGLKRLLNVEIFLDESGLNPGEDYLDRLKKVIDEAQVVIVLIGRQWNIAGRLLDPDDVVRREVARALKMKVRVLPIL